MRIFVDSNNAVTVTDFWTNTLALATFTNRVKLKAAATNSQKAGWRSWKIEAWTPQRGADEAGAGEVGATEALIGPPQSS